MLQENALINFTTSKLFPDIVPTLSEAILTSFVLSNLKWAHFFSFFRPVEGRLKRGSCILHMRF